MAPKNQRSKRNSNVSIPNSAKNPPTAGSSATGTPVAELSGSVDNGFPLPPLNKISEEKPVTTVNQPQKGKNSELSADKNPSTASEQTEPIVAQNGESVTDKGENAVHTVSPTPIETPVPEKETLAVTSDTPLKITTNGHVDKSMDAPPTPVSPLAPKVPPLIPMPAPSSDVTKELPPNITVNTDIPRRSMGKSKPPTSVSPGVRDVAEHAAKLKSVLAQVGAIYDMVGRQAAHMSRVSPAVLGTDQLNKIRDEIVSDEAIRLQKLDALRAQIEDSRARLIKRGNEEISSIIKKYVHEQVKIRVKKQIDTRMRVLTTQLQGGTGQVVQQRAALVNVEAKVNNSMIRTKWPREPLHPVLRPMPDPTASRKFPQDFNQLVRLSSEDARALVKDYHLKESENKVEPDRHFENLNNIMSHFGVGYRVNPAGSIPILTSVWDR